MQAARMLVAQPLSAAGFARYGRVIDGSAAAGLTLVNDGTSRRSEAAPALRLQQADDRAVLAVYDALARRFPFAARTLERHRLSDQVFLPLGGARRSVLLVAPPGPPPTPQDCEAFLTDGAQGVLLAAGTWHHGLLALDAGPWAVLERRALDGTPDCDEVHWPAPLDILLPG